MKSKQLNFTHDSFLSMLDECENTKSVVAVIITAMGQRAQNRYSDMYLSSLLIKAGEKIASFV